MNSTTVSLYVKTKFKLYKKDLRKTHFVGRNVFFFKTSLNVRRDRTIE